MSQSHRKKIKHYDLPGHVHELTFSCYKRLPLLVEDTWRHQFCLSIDRAIENHQYQLFAYVIMPEHVHLIVHPQPESSPISGLLRAMKRPFSYRIKQQLETSNLQLLKKLTIQQRPNVTTFRFWQEGPGYDRNLTESSTILTAIDYVHNNPVRRGLCTRAIDWKWSSAQWYDTSNWDSTQSLPKITRPRYDLLD